MNFTFPNNRKRKARTYNNWFEADGLLFGDKWYYFKDGDVVEFTENGRLVQRTVILKTTSYKLNDMGHETDIEVRQAFVKVNRRKIRITNAPPMRLFLRP